MEETVLRKRKLTSQDIPNVPRPRTVSDSSADFSNGNLDEETVNRPRPSRPTLLPVGLPRNTGGNVDEDDLILDNILPCINNGKPRPIPSSENDEPNLQEVGPNRPARETVQQHIGNEEVLTRPMPTGLEGYSCRGGVMPLGIEDMLLGLDQNGCAVPELNFREVPETPATRKKVQEIEKVLSQKPVNVGKLRKLAMSEGGLIHDNLRKRVWPKLVGIEKIPPLSPLTDKELEANGEYNQVVLDVNRSLKRFPPGIPYDQRVILQDQLTRLIMRVIIKHPHLRYYQGYHDVAVTVLLVVGEEAAFPIMEKLSTGHLNECMAETMDKTSHLLNYIYPLMKRMHSKLYDFMERSGCGTLFCLPWYLTWFGHNLNHYTDVVRLYDYFMSTEKLLPLYLAAAIVVHRKDEIFNVECDMPYVHSLLSNIPDDLPFEKLLKEATQLYKTYPPSSIEHEVNERTRLSRIQMRGRDNKAVSRREPFGGFLRLVPRYSLFLATATLVVGLYAYIRTASALEEDVLFPFR